MAVNLQIAYPDPIIQKIVINRGVAGVAGVGIPTGGTTGQGLVKASGTDYDTEWSDAGAVMESDYTPAFSLLVQQSGTGSPSAVTVGTNTLVGRVTGGGSEIDDLSPSTVRTLLNVEDGADVTDTANVTSAGALMDSEVTNLAQVKSFDSTDYAVASQGALNYIGAKTLTSATSISWDVSDGSGRSASIVTLGHDATLTLSNLADGETVEVAIQQDGTGSRTLTLAHAGLTVAGITTAIAGLGASAWGFATARRVGSNLIVEAYALPV